MAGNTGSYEFVDPIHNLSMTKSITTLSIGQMGANPSSITFGNAPDEEQIRLFGGMQALMKSCVDCAEDIKNRIHEIIINRATPSSEEERKELMKMDFMAIKQWFMNDVRSSKIYQEFSEFNSTKKLKPFSKAFNTFILDRNKYTHGKLCFLNPTYEYVLEYIGTPEHQIRYAMIDTDILKSYNSCYNIILNAITEYNIVHQQKRLSK